LAALERNYKPTDLILDAALAYDQCSGCKKWKPANYTKKFYGPSPMRLGIEKSSNLMTARLAIKLIEEEEIIKNYIKKGYTNQIIAEKLNKEVREVELFVSNITNKRNNKNIIQDYAAKFGISENLPSYLSMSLGAGETNLLSITNAYGMIVNGGKRIKPTLIDRVQDRRGITIFRHDERECKYCEGDKSNRLQIPSEAIKDSREQIISSSSAYQMVSMLKGAVKRGTGVIVNSLGRNLAGKTGTTNANTDTWFVGFSSDLVAGIFVGFDNPRPLGYKETGSSVAAPIFRDFMKKTLENTPDLPFRRPAGIKLISVNSKTGFKANSKEKDSILEAFKPGQLPNLSYDKKLIDLKKSNKFLKTLSPLY
jgi:penicillin-binding protein 1A